MSAQLCRSDNLETMNPDVSTQLRRPDNPETTNQPSTTRTPPPQSLIPPPQPSIPSPGSPHFNPSQFGPNLPGSPPSQIHDSDAPFQAQPPSSIVPQPEPQPPIPKPPSPNLEPQPLRRSARSTLPSVRLWDYICSHVTTFPTSSSSSSPSSVKIKGTRYPLCNYLSYHRYTPSHRTFTAQITQAIEPHTYAESAPYPEWQAAMRYELQALEDNNTWILTPLPAGKTLIGCRRVYKIKHR
ncbi:vegetative cell wall protein gp1-like [Rosa chinensis]|uniref:vegetative cell wall protein gp1-like n=1 Tax=Rosa chinensis TaxID=74649 RepID=UPI000D0967D9|nr:vegetative cell wall protein gp1-like [Rosa chinensis]